MRQKLRKIIITGGAGFIGSHFVKKAIERGLKPVIIDKLTYAADMKRLREVGGKFIFYKADICDYKKLIRIFRKERPQLVVNLAAETHVDRSILDARVFLQTNIMGTKALLDATREFNVKRFIHISTDEVYGDIERGKFKECSPLKPNSPYAASKAAADLLIRSYIRTYGFPAVIIRPSNNYGPWQYPEKLIPLSILKVLRGEKIPVYATGKNVREWLFVEDCAQGIMDIVNKGRIGEIYNLGSNKEQQNIAVVKTLLKVLKKDNRLIEFVKDRPGHDIRYRLDSSKALKETGFEPKVNFNQGISLTVAWALTHKGWLKSRWKEISLLYKR